MTFPTALVKQIEYPRKTSKFNSLRQAFGPEYAEIVSRYEDGCDFDISFNSNRNWYFGNGTIDEDQADFKLVAAKHITQGLGFASNLIKITRRGAELVVPKVYLDDELPNTFYMAYMSPLDSLSRSRTVNLWNLAKNIFSPLTTFSHDPYSETFREFKKLGLYSKNLTDYILTNYEQSGLAFTGTRLTSEKLLALIPIVSAVNVMHLANVYSG